MQRYFISKDQINNNHIFILGEDCHHILNVMRMKLDAKVYVSDEENSYLCKIINLDLQKVTLEIIEYLNEEKELPVNVSIAQGMVRREKMEEVIDYTCELGAYEYIPVMMERSIVKINNDKLDKKNDRFNRIAKEASEQSHRVKMMKVHKVLTWKEFLESSKSYDLCLYAYEASLKDDSLKRILKKKDYENILVVIGPEGGISDKEVKDLKGYGFLPISLGPRILRTQVAPLYVLSAISYELEGKE